ncbi:hypothetical protein V1478_016828 [Vespula squamosa]|uniref:Uncharacterized protein n=1 Tax=Vespula squamosa TaxID=30214 RepID=A0ABD2A0V6_VESSQ
MHSFTSNIFVFLRKDHCAKPRIMSNKVRLTTISFFTELIRIHHKHVIIISASVTNNTTKMETASCDD